MIISGKFEDIYDCLQNQLTAFLVHCPSEYRLRLQLWIADAGQISTDSHKIEY